MSSTPPAPPSWFRRKVAARGDAPQTDADSSSNESPTPARRIADTLQRLRQRPVDWKRFAQTTGLSTLLHLLVIGVLSWIVIHSPLVDDVLVTIVRFDDGSREPTVEFTPHQPEKIADDREDVVNFEPLAMSVADLNQPVMVSVDDLAPTINPHADATVPVKLDLSDATSGRSTATRASMVEKFGGNAASEAAVAAGLRWLIRHQLADGGWSFEHTEHPDCDGKCSQPGNMGINRTAATGLALLSFLGAGETHQAGQYQPQIDKALKFLVQAGKTTSSGFDLRGETGIGSSHAAFYSHGICTIALCEAFALTKDAALRMPAQQALNFIVSSQDPNGGGWRYTPQQSGDTSVVGWQIMALKSGQNAGLQVPTEVMKNAERFLNSVGRVEYGYTDSKQPRKSMTAVGLLCRMYLGWGRREGSLRRGVVSLDRAGPDKNNMYYNYYATQVLHHYGGDQWTRWNDVLRDHLVKTQLTAKAGHAEGSWDVADPHGSSGGRLYMTCLAVMTLEVYYRHLPLYQRDKLLAK